jgi:hypothetical protein
MAAAAEKPASSKGTGGWGHGLDKQMHKILVGVMFVMVTGVLFMNLQVRHWLYKEGGSIMCCVGEEPSFHTTLSSSSSSSPIPHHHGQKLFRKEGEAEFPYRQVIQPHTSAPS